MTTEWKFVRVKASTKARIDQFIDELTAQLETDVDAARTGRWDTVTADEAIRVLLNRVANHRKRAKNARKLVKASQTTSATDCPPTSN